MKINNLYIFSIFLSFIISNITIANCNYQLQSPSITQSISNTNINVAYELSIKKSTNSGGLGCLVYYYYFSKGNSSSYSRYAVNSFGEKINYNLFKKSNQSGILKDKNEASGRSEYIRGFLRNSNTTSTKNFYFNLPSYSSGSMVRGGVYSDNVSLNVYSLGNANNADFFETNRNIPIIITVPKVLNLSLIDSGGPFDIGSTNKTLNFGELETGKELSFDLRVASNAGYRVLFSSLNNGKLGNANSSKKIDYQLFVANSNIDLSHSAGSPSTIASGSGVTSTQGVLFPIKVRIGNTSDNQSGDYDDYITITAITND